MYFDASKDPKNGFYRQYCVDDSFRAEIQRRYQKRDLPYSALSYVLTIKVLGQTDWQVYPHHRARL